MRKTSGVHQNLSSELATRALPRLQHGVLPLGHRHPIGDQIAASPAEILRRAAQAIRNVLKANVPLAGSGPPAKRQRIRITRLRRSNPRAVVAERLNPQNRAIDIRAQRHLQIARGPSAFARVSAGQDRLEHRAEPAARGQGPGTPRQRKFGRI